jgi:hypothetical protein
LIKFCIHYFDNCIRHYKRKKEHKENRETINGDHDDVILEMDEMYSKELEESLENFYLKLAKSIAKKKIESQSV